MNDLRWGAGISAVVANRRQVTSVSTNVRAETASRPRLRFVPTEHTGSLVFVCV